MGGHSSSKSSKSTNVTTNTKTAVSTFTANNGGTTIALNPQIDFEGKGGSGLFGSDTSFSSSLSVGDIGFTGANAIALANIIEAGSVSRETLFSQNYGSLLQASGAQYNQLIGGANNLIETASHFGEEKIESGERVHARDVETGASIFGELIKAGSNLIGNAFNEADRIRQASTQNAAAVRETALAAGQNRELNTDPEWIKIAPILIGVVGLVIPLMVKGNK